MTMAVAAIVLGTLYLFREPLLRRVAELWIVDDPVTVGDAIIVLGGGLQTRPFAAAALYHQGYAPRVLLMNVEQSPTTALGLTPTEFDLTRKVLLDQGVPDSSLTAVGENLSSSYEEAVAVRNWARNTGAKRLIILTDLFHTRRVSWLYSKMFRGTGIDILVVAVPGRKYSSANWWRAESGVLDFQSEIVKSLYYHLKY